MFRSFVSISTVGGAWSGWSDDACLDIEEYLPASEPSISPFAAIEKH